MTRRRYAIAAIIVLASAWTGPVSASPIPPFEWTTIDGRDWLFPADFTGLSWNEVNAVCPESTDGAACSGALAGFQLDGWALAGIADVNALFNGFIGCEALTGDLPGSCLSDDPLLPIPFVEAFGLRFTLEQTHHSDTGRVEIQGWAAGAMESAAFAPRFRWDVVDDGRNEFIPSSWDTTVVVSDLTGSQDSIGAWLFRLPTADEQVPLPSPGTLPLLAMGLLLFAVRLLGRRRSPDSAASRVSH